jgi:hypothetical protein
MDSTLAGPGLLRVRRGAAGPEELAALMAVLHLRAAALASADLPAARPLAAWNRPERHAPYRDPRGWSAPHAGR